MTEKEKPVSESSRLRAMAAETRLQAIRSQLAAGLTLCQVAGTEIDYGHVDKAREVVEKLWKMADGVRRHLDEPNHVPAEHIAELRDKLAKVDSRILAVEELERAVTVPRPPNDRSNNRSAGGVRRGGS